MNEPRIGVFGLLGSGNLGNDGSLAAVLGYLRAAHPDAVVDALCGGPELVRARYGIEAAPLYWSPVEFRTASGPGVAVVKAFGKLVDAARTVAWVHRHDLVIVPGMGVLEATLPLRPWGFPYSLLSLCAAGRLSRVPVALVSVGATVIRERALRAVVVAAARLATYRSYRDELSRDAMRAMGVDVRRDPVYPDLAFGLGAREVPAEGGVVGVGVMAYRGGNEHRARADEVCRAYVAKLTRFVRWLLDGGRQVRLFVGDELDRAVVEEIRAELPAATAANMSTLDDLLVELSRVDTVVATRYHNVLAAVRLAKPTISVGYAAKNDVLMADMGLAEFCQPILALDVDRLVERFTELERRAGELSETLAVRVKERRQRLDEQFAELSALVGRVS